MDGDRKSQAAMTTQNGDARPEYHGEESDERMTSAGNGCRSGYSRKAYNDAEGRSGGSCMKWQGFEDINRCVLMRPNASEIGVARTATLDQKTHVSRLGK